MTAEATSSAHAPSLTGGLLWTRMGALRRARVLAMFKLCGPPLEGESPSEYVARVRAGLDGRLRNEKLIDAALEGQRARLLDLFETAPEEAEALVQMLRLSAEARP
jgi:hypothetical protein